MTLADIFGAAGIVVFLMLFVCTLFGVIDWNS